MQQDSNTFISIALCTYNGEKHLAEQLISILNQTYTNFELIIWDDASIDETYQVLQNFKKIDSRIKIFKNDLNVGYIKNFQKAIEKCSGKYVFLADQDDIWNINKISTILPLFINDVLLIYHDSEFIDQHGRSFNKKISDLFTLDEKLSSLSFLILNGISGHSLVFDSLIIKKILPIPQSIHHDCWISYIAISAGSIKFIPDVLVKYRQHGNNETNLLGVQNKKKVSRLKVDKNILLIEQAKQFASIVYNPQHKQVFKFYTLLQKRQDDYLSLSLFIFMLLNHQAIFSFKKKKGLSRIFYALQYIWGLKIKNIFN